MEPAPENRSSPIGCLALGCLTVLVLLLIGISTCGQEKPELEPLPAARYAAPATAP